MSNMNRQIKSGILRSICGYNILVVTYLPTGCQQIYKLNNEAMLIWKDFELGVMPNQIIEKYRKEYQDDDNAINMVRKAVDFFLSIQNDDKFMQRSGYVDCNTNEFSQCGLQQLYEKSKLLGIPLFGGIELTWRCNLNCPHCFIRDNNSEIMDIEKWKYILNSLSRNGCLYLAFTGGEPLLHPSFIEIYLYAKSQGFLITLFTNATLISSEHIEVFKKYPPYGIDISLYGSCPSVYDRVTATKGAFCQFVNGLELLEKAKLKYRLKSLLITTNESNIEEMQKFSLDRHLPFVYDSIIQPRLDGSPGPELHRLSVGQTVSLELKNTKKCNLWLEHLSRYPTYESDYIFTCSAGQTAFQVDCSGRVGLCIMYRKPNISLFDISFSSAWKELKILRGSKYESNSKCKFCNYKSTCDQCPGWALLECGDEEMPVSYLCELAKMRNEYLQKNRSECHESKQNAGN